MPSTSRLPLSRIRVSKRPSLLRSPTSRSKIHLQINRSPSCTYLRSVSDPTYLIERIPIAASNHTSKGKWGWSLHCNDKAERVALTLHIPCG